MRIRQRVGRNIIASIRYMNIVIIYHICDVIKRMRKYAWSDVSRSSIRFTYSSVGRHNRPCICHNSQTCTWNDVIPYKGRMIFLSLSLHLPYLCVLIVSFDSVLSINKCFIRPFLCSTFCLSFVRVFNEASLLYMFLTLDIIKCL